MWDVKLKLKICSSANHWDTDVLHFSILKFKKDKYLVSFQGFILTLFSHSRKWVWLSPKYIACRGRIISEAAYTYFWVTPSFRCLNLETIPLRRVHLLYNKRSLAKYVCTNLMFANVLVTRDWIKEICMS